MLTLSAYSQTPELVLEKGVSAHKEIDAVYKNFSEAYKTLDVEKVTNLYTETAAYLPPDNEILQGREQIRPTFKSFFDWIKKEGRTMTISFQIVQRKTNKNLAYDVGIYTIRQYKDGKEVGTGQGKFVVVAVKEKDGKWRFQVDGYSGLKPEKPNESE
ncbi:MAG: YybH family protein [Pyrinomonadaceae bacterium]